MAHLSRTQDPNRLVGLLRSQEQDAQQIRRTTVERLGFRLPREAFQRVGVFIDHKGTEPVARRVGIDRARRRDQLAPNVRPSACYARSPIP